MPEPVLVEYRISVSTEMEARDLCGSTILDFQAHRSAEGTPLWPVKNLQLVSVTPATEENLLLVEMLFAETLLTGLNERRVSRVTGTIERPCNAEEFAQHWPREFAALGPIPSAYKIASAGVRHLVKVCDFIYADPTLVAENLRAIGGLSWTHPDM